jgi:cation:H+ antiporter
MVLYIAVGTSAGFGISAFVISVIFIGFDPENLAVGAVGSVEGVPGIALGSIIGAAMVAIAFAFGVTAIIVPMEFKSTPRSILVIPILAVLLFTVVAWDGLLSRTDGAILLAAFGTALIGLVWMSSRGIDIEPEGEIAETLHESSRLNKWKALGQMVLSLVAIVVGSELLVSGFSNAVRLCTMAWPPRST